MRCFAVGTLEYRMYTLCSTPAFNFIACSRSYIVACFHILRAVMTGTHVFVTPPKPSDTSVYSWMTMGVRNLPAVRSQHCSTAPQHTAYAVPRHQTRPTCARLALRHNPRDART